MSNYIWDNMNSKRPLRSRWGQRKSSSHPDSSGRGDGRGAGGNPTSSLSPLAGYAARQYPDPPGFYAPNYVEPWLREAMLASHWLDVSKPFMAVQVGMKAAALAPRHQLGQGVGDVGIALSRLANEVGDESPDQVIDFLVELLDWVLQTGWLDLEWSNVFSSASPEGQFAWNIFPGALIALINRARTVGNIDLVSLYKPIALNRLPPRAAAMPYWVDQWISQSLLNG
jgi:hypothetical protein